MQIQPPSPRRLGVGVGGGNGYVGLLIDSEVYANMAATTYKGSTDPGPYTQHGSGDTSSAQSNANKIHKEEWKVYNLNENVYADLK